MDYFSEVSTPGSRLFLFALLYRKEIEAPAIAMTHSRPLGERVVEPGLNPGVFGSKGHVLNHLAPLPEGSGRGGKRDPRSWGLAWRTLETYLGCHLDPNTLSSLSIK